MEGKWHNIRFLIVEMILCPILLQFQLIHKSFILHVFIYVLNVSTGFKLGTHISYTHYRLYGGHTIHRYRALFLVRSSSSPYLIYCKTILKGLENECTFYCTLYIYSHYIHVCPWIFQFSSSFFFSVHIIIIRFPFYHLEQWALWRSKEPLFICERLS